MIKKIITSMIAMILIHASAYADSGSPKIDWGSGNKTPEKTNYALSCRLQGEQGETPTFCGREDAPFIIAPKQKVVATLTINTAQCFYLMLDEKRNQGQGLLGKVGLCKGDNKTVWTNNQKGNVAVVVTINAVAPSDDLKNFPIFGTLSFPTK